MYTSEYPMNTKLWRGEANLSLLYVKITKINVTYGWRIQWLTSCTVHLPPYVEEEPEQKEDDNNDHHDAQLQGPEIRMYL